MRKSIDRILTLAKRNITEILRDPLSLIFTIAMPLAMEVLFYFLFHSQTSQFEMRYLAPGIVAFSQAFLALFTGILIAVDRNTSFLTRLYVSKAKSYEFIFGYALSVLPIAAVQSVLFFVVGGIIDPALFELGMLWAVLLSAFTSLFYIAFGILFGAVCNEKSVGGIASIVITGQSILSGMWFPVDGMSKGFVYVMRALPFKNGADVLQSALSGTFTFADFGLPLIVVAAYAAVVFVVAILCFRAKMNAK